MNNSDVYVGLDIGTSSIKVVISQKIGNQLQIIGAGNTPSEGLKSGIIVDIDETATAIRGAIKDAQSRPNLQITEVIVGLPAHGLEIIPVSGTISITNEDKHIHYSDVSAVAKQAISRSLPLDRKIVDLIAEEFVVDGYDGIKDPNEMIGVRLEMKGLAYVAKSSIIENARVAVQKAGLNVKEFVLSPLALASNILDDSEQDFGTAVLDMGGGQTTTFVVHDHKLKFAHVNPEGGEYVTKDISKVLNTSFPHAEAYKRTNGYADADNVSESKKFQVEIVGGQPKECDENYLAQIIQARIDQILQKSYTALETVRALNLPGGFVLTGGNAALPNIVDEAQKFFGENVRLYCPTQVGLRHPAYSRALSYAHYSAEQSPIQKVIKDVIMEELIPNIDNQEVFEYDYEDNDEQHEEKQTKKLGFLSKITEKLQSIFEN